MFQSPPTSDVAISTTPQKRKSLGMVRVVSMGLANCQKIATVHGENDDKPMKKRLALSSIFVTRMKRLLLLLPKESIPCSRTIDIDR